jgi:glycosyltransferase involved in cell wall biosynthesis
MKILFDEFPLGADLYDPTYKTGVYRVVEHLARHLAAVAQDPANELEVAFYAAKFPSAAWRYYRRHLRGRGTRFAARPWQLAVAYYAEAVDQFCERTASARNPALDFLRWGLTRKHAALVQAGARLSQGALQSADICHSSFFEAPAAVLAQPRLRRFTTIYDLIPLTNPEFCGQASVDALRKTVTSFRADDFVTCISHATRSRLLEHAPQLQPERVFVTHLAAGEWCRPERDAARIARAGAMYGLAPGAPYFLSLCTLEPRKNLEAVIRAFVRLRQENQISREHRLVLVGNQGWKTEKILAALDEAQSAREAIVLPGFVPDADLPALYSGALAFVFVSRLEGFGLPPLEAMQCGTPVITSNTSSLPEVVGEAGLTVGPDDIDGLCAHMLRLSQDAALRARLSALSLARARGFSWDRFGAEILSAYRQAMSLP